MITVLFSFPLADLSEEIVPDPPTEAEYGKMIGTTASIISVTAIASIVVMDVVSFVPVVKQIVAYISAKLF